MEPSNQVFLGKEGRISGPFTREKVRELQAKGEYANYSWIWDSASPGWVPTDPPPSDPPTGSREPKAVAQDPAVPANIQVLCHNNESIVSGSVSRVSKAGLTLTTDSFAADMPPFGRGSRVWLNLLDETAGKAENIRVTVARVVRQNHCWEYQLQWEQPPVALRDLSN